MKVLFTADIHIKLGQKNVPIEWAKQRYIQLVRQLKVLQARCDMMVIGGDIFDKVPTMEELEIYFDLIYECMVPTIIYSGNHEALKKNTTFLTNLFRPTHLLNPLVQIIDEVYSLNNMDFIPYNRLKEFDPKSFSGDILFTHVRGDIPPHVKSEIDLDLLNRWKLVIAGDLHSHDNSQRNILYPGSPCTTSFHRNNVDTGIIILDTEKLEYEWVKLNLPQLIRKTINVGDPMPATDYDHTIYEVEGGMAELGALEDNDLIDKKVVIKENDTALILDPKMSLQEELKEYLLYILQLDENTTENVIQHLNDNMDKLGD